MHEIRHEIVDPFFFQLSPGFQISEGRTKSKRPNLNSTAVFLVAKRRKSADNKPVSFSPYIPVRHLVKSHRSIVSYEFFVGSGGERLYLQCGFSIYCPSATK